MKKSLIVIAGCTACGKTNASILLAKKLNGEIISADSMQIYKYMDIGTAKPSLQDMKGIKHYMIDELYPDDEFNVMLFQERAKNYIDEIYSKNKIPILVGGTGFYINALVYDNNFMETKNDFKIRNDLYLLAEKNGAEYVYNILKKVDSASAEKIHFKNIKRVVRAIEFYKLTGKPISEHNREEKKKESPFDLKFIILNMERAVLYERINKRVDLMIDMGLVGEVEKLLNMGYNPELVSMQGLGYKEIVPYIMGETSLECAIYEIKKKTRHFAKRQITWFKGQTNGEGKWIDVTGINISDTTDKILGVLK